MTEAPTWLVESPLEPTCLSEALALHLALWVEEKLRTDSEFDGALPDDVASLYADCIISLEEHIAAAVPKDDEETVALLGWLAEYVATECSPAVARKVAQNAAGALARRYEPANN